MVNVTTLADFKRFLAQSGATIQTVRNDVVAARGITPETNPELFAPRTVKKLQTNAVCFSNDAWLYFKKAGTYRFAGDRVIVDATQDGSFAKVIEYKLSIADAITAAA